MTISEDSKFLLEPGESTFMLESSGGNELELLKSCPENPRPIIGVVCHPHSLFGGTLNNKVVYTIAKAFRELGLCTIRFNFRGVGKSTGAYDQGIGETEDVLTIFKWLQKQVPDYKIWLAGFSFGSYVAARANQAWPVEKLVTVAPPVVNFDFSQLKMPESNWILVQGDADEIVDPKAVFSWAESLAHPPEIIRIEGATHFFHGHLTLLRDLLVKALA